MGVVKNTLKDNYIFFVRELARLDDEIKVLPPGSIYFKKIGKPTFYYHQWWKVIKDHIAEQFPESLP